MAKVRVGDIYEYEGIRYVLEKAISRDPTTGITVYIGRRLDTQEAEYVEVR
jgi:hypothetical protein